MKKTVLYLVALVVLVVVLGMAVSFVQSPKIPVHAQSVSCPYSGASVCLDGWAWSGTTGWISFNSSDANTGSAYDVAVDDSGNLSGYAWSGNVGWISFNPSDLNVQPTCFNNIPAHIDMSSSSQTYGQVTGWARVVSEEGRVDSSGTNSSDGWDGCMELSGINHSSPDATGNGGVTYTVNSDNTNSAISGYAWGGNVMGWVQFMASCAGSTGCVTTINNSTELDMQGSANVGPLKDIPVTAIVGTPQKINMMAQSDGTASANISWSWGTAFASTTLSFNGDWPTGFNPTNNGSYTAQFTNVTATVTKSFAFTYNVASGRSSIPHTKELDVVVTPYSVTQNPVLCTLPAHAISCNGDVGQPGSPTGATTCSTNSIVTCQFKCDLTKGYKLNSSKTACIRSSIIEI